MPTSSLDAVYDAIHGRIDLATLGSEQFRLAVANVLSSASFSRLKRIKQLGYVSTNYISAAHDRYSHSIGSMYMMRRISDQLRATGGFIRGGEDSILAAARKRYSSKIFSGDDTFDIDRLIEHLMIAALIQDIGELPYHMGTSNILTPSNLLIDEVKAHRTFYRMELKTMYALAWLRRNTSMLDIFDIDLLSDLLSAPSDLPHGLTAMRHIVDGAVDADRLDYVHRDAFHLLGIRRDPNVVISTLLYYDSEGPVFSASSPVADFLTVRATLWASAYLSPPNRFRTTLLRLLLRDIANGEPSVKGNRDKGDKPNPSLIRSVKQRGLTYDDFSKFDDNAIEAEVERARDQRATLNSHKAQLCVEILTNRSPVYEFFWLKEPLSSQYEEDKPTDLPDHLFVDSYTDYLLHRLYTPKSIRVAYDAYRYIGKDQTVELEQCSGPFNFLLNEQASGLPMPGSIAVFKPKDPSITSGSIWRVIDTGLESGSLYYRLRKEGRESAIQFESDTRGKAGFEGKELFISFAYEDIEVVKEIATIMAERRQRYFCLVSPNAGVGATARENSIAALKKAQAALIVCSTNYHLKYRNSSGPIHAEVTEMTFRVHEKNGFLVVPINLDDTENAKTPVLPWSYLGYPDGDQPLMLPLRGASRASMTEAVDGVITRLRQSRS